MASTNRPRSPNLSLGSSGDWRSVRRQGRPHRGGQVSGRPQARADRIGPHARGGAAGDRRCRAEHRRRRRDRQLPGTGCARPRFLRGHRPGGPQRARTALPLVHVGSGDRGPDRPGDRGVHGGQSRAGQPRRGLSIGVGIHRRAAGRRRPGLGAVRRRRSCPRTWSGRRPSAHCRRRTGWRCPPSAICTTSA